MKLPRRQIHVWRGDVPGRRHLDRLAYMLDPFEQSRVAEFSNPASRGRFIASHLMLRDLLSSYLPVPAVGSIVRWLPRGKKPRLKWPYSLARIEFSISTSHEQIVVALARWPVGVDIQWKEELRDVSGTPDSPSSSSLWSRAEAVVKMRGTGLDELERFLVHGVSPVSVVDVTGNHTDVVVTDLNVPEGYSGAVAACGPYQVIERTFDYGR